ncbi:hypothetical protein X926_00900 [Petrotoga sp. HWHPT.55.6.3]|nr:hypothetical protein X926_00900 [Petrotoga sp. HWHPT.55.6.3]
MIKIFNNHFFFRQKSFRKAKKISKNIPPPKR